MIPPAQLSWFARIGKALRRMTAHRDPRMAYGNMIALLVGSNQPFFPLTLYAVLGDAARPSLWGVLSTFVFCAMPIVARRDPMQAKILLSLYASLHTAGYAVLMGQGAGFELFFLPCILLAALLFPARQKVIGWSLCAVPLLLYLVLQRLQIHPHSYSGETVATLWQINAVSVACLTAMMGMLAPAPVDRYR